MDDLELIAATLVAAARTAPGLGPASRGEEVIDRLLLVRTARQLLDKVELKAVEDGRKVRVTWVKLGAPLGIGTKNGMVQRRQRLIVATRMGKHDLKNPQTFREAARSDIRQAASREEWIEANYREVQEGARALLAERDSLPQGPYPEERLDELARFTNEWLDELAEYLDKPDTADQRYSVFSNFRFATESIDELLDAVDCNLPPAARTALDRAHALIADYRRHP